MNLSVTIAAESIASITAAVRDQITQPDLIPALACASDSQLAERLTNDSEFVTLVAESMDATEVAQHIDLSDLAGEFNIRRIAEEVNVDASDIAENIDMSELAQHIDIDTDDMADRVANNLDLSDIARHVADEVDYETLADAMNTKALAREIVGQFINNEEFRRSFMDTLLSTLSANLK